MVQVFIDQGWPLNMADEQGDTALHLACLEGHQDIVEQLLQRQGKVDISNQAGDTPLILAIAQGERDIVQQLLQAGAGPNFAPGGESPLLATLQTEGLGEEVRSSIAELLLQQGAEPNQTIREGKTLLMVAAEHNFPTLIKLLTKYNAQVNQTDQRGATALMWACHRGSLEAVQALLGHPQIDLQFKNAGGSTALQLATLSQHWPIVRLLKSHLI
jgi:ankyrin repeat protein